ncbi:MAG: lipopolysaccharide heptosyltransferase II [Verrucomicrobiales bacterium]|nr:lipopolysaccharide heptosyltransferase II [Verrucomicrobiales bacterium]
MKDSGSDSTQSGARVRYLVRSPNPLGDACMALPAVRALKKSGPDVEITICCRENLGPMWEARDEIDAVIPFSRDLPPREVGKLLRRHGTFDIGVLLPNSFRSALELKFGGVHRLVGYHRWLRWPLVWKSIPEPDADREPTHHVHRYLAIAELLGADLSDIDDLLALPPTPRPIGSAEKKIHIGICPGAEYGNAKRYPVERYAEAIQSLRGKRPEIDISVSVFGSPAEREIGEDLAGRLDPPGHNRAGETSIAELVEELRTCHFVATNDTGTMHLAAALGVPTVAIFGSTEPALTAPVGTIHRVIRHQVDCSPCFLRECPIDYRCMLRIPPETVVGEMETLLDRDS